jgi:outer membrane protein OmpA-like peptidoglycan-associated protein
MSKLATLLAGLVVFGLVSAGAHAQQTPGWYIGLQGGWTGLTGAASSLTAGGVTRSFTANTDSGYNIGGDFGYEWRSGLRLEGEVMYRHASFDNFTSSAGVGPLGGSANSTGIMADILYDIMPHSLWTPYVGAGIGMGGVSINSFSAPALGIPGNSVTNWEFAYQGIAGVKVQLSPRVSLSFDYRYFATPSPTYTLANAGGQLKTEYHSNNVMLGLAYHFAPPPPPAPPQPVVQPPPPPPPLTPPPSLFIVYFDFDKAALTPEGLQVVQEAADTFRQRGSATIQVAGYTDLTGTQEYNMGLSKRRADAVRAQLVQDGVPDSVISASWYGMEDPAVPTPLGVREAKNRRVEIRL